MENTTTATINPKIVVRILKKIKCNNINVNLNGFNGIDVNAVPPALNGLATDEAQAADEGEIGASSSGKW